MNQEELNNLSSAIIGAAIEVHKILGPGLLEKSYRLALKKELELRGLNVAEEVPISFNYKGVEIDDAYRTDLIVEDEIVLELKATENDNPLYARQLYTYLRLLDKRLGLLINFNRNVLVDGLERVVNKY